MYVFEVDYFKAKKKRRVFYTPMRICMLRNIKKNPGGRFIVQIFLVLASAKVNVNKVR